MEGQQPQVVSAIESAKEEILVAINDAMDRVRDEVAVSDDDLRRAIDWLRGKIPVVIAQAQADAKLELKLDDLFDLALRLTRDAKTIDAIDLDVIRWQDDNRMRTYFAQNLLALRDGCQVRRIYVISPRVSEADVARAEQTIASHLGCNDDADVRNGGGRIELGVLHHAELRDPNFKDFAIFDRDKAMIEDFDSDWITTFRGRLTKDAVEVSEYQVYFDGLWAAAEPLRSQNDVRAWREQLTAHLVNEDFDYDVFLGYCSAANDTARAVKEFLSENEYSYRDWKHFSPGSLLIEEIERACRSCRLGLFLFTRDDEQVEGDRVPRDNVVFECGYFLSRKGNGRVLVISEAGVKTPSDIAGNIALQLDDRDDTRTIHTKLRQWLNENLGR